MRLSLALALVLALAACGGNNEDSTMTGPNLPDVKPPPATCASNPDACR